MHEHHSNKKTSDDTIINFLCYLSRLPVVKVQIKAKIETKKRGCGDAPKMKVGLERGRCYKREAWVERPLSKAKLVGPVGSAKKTWTGSAGRRLE